MFAYLPSLIKQKMKNSKSFPNTYEWKKQMAYGRIGWPDHFKKQNIVHMEAETNKAI